MKKVILGLVVLTVVFSSGVVFAKDKEVKPQLYSETISQDSNKDIAEYYESSQLVNLYLLDIITVNKDIREQNKEVVKSIKENTILLQKQISLLEKLVSENGESEE